MEGSFRRIDLPIGDCIQRAWDLTRDNLGALILFTLCICGIQLSLAVMAAIGTLITAEVLPRPFGRLWGELSVLPIQMISILISPALTAGYFLYLRKRLRAEPAAFADFFEGFRSILQFVAFALVSGILTLIGLILCILPGLYLILGYLFAPFLIVGQKLDFWKAMETSRQGVTANLGSIIILMLVLIGINIAGALACLVGLIVTVPLTYCVMVIAYQYIFDAAAATSGPVRIDSPPGSGNHA